MQEIESTPAVLGPVDPSWSADARTEMRALDLLDEQDRVLGRPGCQPQVGREPITALDILNEAYSYEVPSSFSRGLAVTLGAGQRVLWLSGTASIDDEGRTVYPGDFPAQVWRTYHNLTRLLASEGATWNDVVRTSCYLRDIDRDYEEFNRIRTLFFRCMGVNPLPASTGIEAHLCRPDLLVEIEGFAFVNADDKARP